MIVDLPKNRAINSGNRKPVVQPVLPMQIFEDIKMNIRTSNTLLVFMALGLIFMAALHGPYAFARDEVCFYDEPDYDGEHFCTSHSIRNLAN